MCVCVCSICPLPLRLTYAQYICLIIERFTVGVRLAFIMAKTSLNYTYLMLFENGRLCMCVCDFFFNFCDYSLLSATLKRNIMQNFAKSFEVFFFFNSTSNWTLRNLLVVIYIYIYCAMIYRMKFFSILALNPTTFGIWITWEINFRHRTSVGEMCPRSPAWM